MTLQNVLKLSRALGVLCFATLASSLFSANSGNVAFALEPTADMTFVYEYRYSSDSGYTDINECVRFVFDAKGVQIAEETVQNFLRNPGLEDSLCEGMKRGQTSNRYLVRRDNDGDFRCIEIVKGVLPYVTFTAARSAYCAL